MWFSKCLGLELHIAGAKPASNGSDDSLVRFIWGSAEWGSLGLDRCWLNTFALLTALQFFGVVRKAARWGRKRECFLYWPVRIYFWFSYLCCNKDLEIRLGPVVASGGDGSLAQKWWYCWSHFVSVFIIGHILCMELTKLELEFSTNDGGE